MPWSSIKVTQAGPYSHVLNLPKALKYDEPNEHRITRFPRGLAEALKGPDPSNGLRAKRTIKYLLQANMHQYGSSVPQFLTVTFRENKTDLSEANYELKKFLKKLNYHYVPTNGLKYLAVPEKQKRGSWHYHLVLFNLPYVGDLYRTTRILWGHGSIDYQRISDTQGAIRYIAKYISKRRNRIGERKSYFTSRGLLKPTIARTEEAEQIASCGKLLYEKAFTNEKHPRRSTRYRCYIVSTNHGSNINSQSGTSELGE